MLFLRRVFVALFVLCLSYRAVADYADDVLLAAVAKDNSDSEVVFEDVESLADLIQQLDWQNSNQPERRDLYQKLTNLLGEIDSIRKVSLQELEKQKIDDTQEAYDQARENEQSVENKLLGGASMAAMGVAGMELASAVSEKNVMENAEMQMKNYLATFSCDWADGQRVAGGEIAIELPGGNELTPLVSEYKSLAADLKARKESLELMPGLESEEILDSAIAGLYDDEAIGKTDGAFTSLARALSDETSEDATEWAADKEKINEKVKNTAMVVAVTAVASVAANLAINGIANRKTVVDKAESVRADVYAVLDSVIENCNNALIEQNMLDKIIIGYSNLYKIKDYPECND